MLNGADQPETEFLSHRNIGFSQCRTQCLHEVITETSRLPRYPNQVFRAHRAQPLIPNQPEQLEERLVLTPKTVPEACYGEPGIRLDAFSDRSLDCL